MDCCCTEGIMFDEVVNGGREAEPAPEPAPAPAVPVAEEEDEEERGLVMGGSSPAIIVAVE